MLSMLMLSHLVCLISLQYYQFLEGKERISPNPCTCYCLYHHHHLLPALDNHLQQILPIEN